jgi:hypothetical protein
VKFRISGHQKNSKRERAKQAFKQKEKDKQRAFKQEP